MLTLYALNACRKCLEPILSRGIAKADRLGIEWKITPLTASEALQEFKQLPGHEAVSLPRWFDSQKRRFIDV